MNKGIKSKLDELAELQVHHRDMESEKERLVDEVLTPEVRGQIEEIEQQFASSLATIKDEILRLEMNIKEGVLACGQSIKGDSLYAIYNKGRVTWDAKGLDGYAVANPEVLAFRKEGSPFVAIRGI